MPSATGPRPPPACARTRCYACGAVSFAPCTPAVFHRRRMSGGAPQAGVPKSSGLFWVHGPRGTRRPISQTTAVGLGRQLRVHPPAAWLGPKSWRPDARVGHTEPCSLVLTLKSHECVRLRLSLQAFRSHERVCRTLPSSVRSLLKLQCEGAPT